MYKVLVWDEDSASTKLAVPVLERRSEKVHAEVARIMLRLHRQGSETCGAYTRDTTGGKATPVMDLARGNHHPLGMNDPEDQHRLGMNDREGQHPFGMNDREGMTTGREGQYPDDQPEQTYLTSRAHDDPVRLTDHSV